MARHVVFAAPFFMGATLRFIRGAAKLSDVDLTVVSQEPFESLPGDLREVVAGHWRIDDALDPAHLVHAARALQQRFGPVDRYIGVLEQLQVPLAVAREELGVPGLPSAAAHNFRDKSRMKTLLHDAEIPCARHALAGSAEDARAFVESVGYPVVVKPPAGAGAKGTFRLESDEELQLFLEKHPHHAASPVLYEEFVRGREYSFDSVTIDGELVWHSISSYQPSPLEVLENPWIQWTVFMPRDIAGEQYDAIREQGARALTTLGLTTGLSHMEWFRLSGERIAISEVGARPPGANITTLLSYTHDLDFFEAWPRLMVTGEFEPPKRRYASGAAYIRGQGSGKVRRIHGLEEAQARYGSLVVEAKLPQAGQRAGDSYEGDGYVIVRDPDSDVVENALKNIVQLIQVELA